MPAGRLALAAATAVVILGLGFNLAGYPLLDPDEGRTPKSPVKWRSQAISSFRAQYTSLYR